MGTITDPASTADSLTSTQPTAREREARLLEWMCSRGSVLIGFSGGVDSSYLAAVALEAVGAERTIAVIGRSASYPEAQWEMAHAVAARIGLPVREIATEEMSDPRYAANPSNRCYFCKTELWSKLVPLARELGYAAIVDGTNADDMHGHRPGRAAAREWGVESPLAELGFTKAEIRERSTARNLPTSDVPSSPCLSSRLPTGTAVTALRLGRVEAAERAARAAGVTGDLRVRYHGDTARVEVPYGEVNLWRSGDRRRALRDAIVSAGFVRVELDLRGFRSGMANDTAGVEAVDVLEG